MQFILNCPKCGSADLRRSRTRHAGEWLAAIFAAPYRCRLCDHRELYLRMASRNEAAEEDVVAAEPPVAVAAPAPDAPAAAEPAPVATPAGTDTNTPADTPPPA